MHRPFQRQRRQPGLEFNGGSGTLLSQIRHAELHDGIDLDPTVGDLNHLIRAKSLGAHRRWQERAVLQSITELAKWIICERICCKCPISATLDLYDVI